MNNRIFRSVALILMAAAFAACCIACASPSDTDKPGNTGEAQPAKTAAEVYEDVLAVSGFGSMTPVPKRDYVEIYAIDANKFYKDDYVWYMSENKSLNADEILIFHVENEDYCSVLVNMLRAHLEQQISIAESYSPEEVAKLRKTEIMEVKNASGLWVYYCVGAEYDKMMEVFASDLG